MKASKIILIEDDDGSACLGHIPGISKQDEFTASIVITDAGRILKDRYGVPNRIVESCELVKRARKAPESKPKSIYRSIFDDTDIQVDDD